MQGAPGAGQSIDPHGPVCRVEGLQPIDLCAQNCELSVPTYFATTVGADNRAVTHSSCFILTSATLPGSALRWLVDSFV